MLTKARIIALLVVMLLACGAEEALADPKDASDPTTAPSVIDTPAPSPPPTQTSSRLAGTDSVVVRVAQSGSPGSASVSGSPGDSSGAGSMTLDEDAQILADLCADDPSLPECVPQKQASGPPVEVDPGVAARQAVLSMTVPAPGLVVLPDPEGNKWGMIPIGLPVWAGDTNPGSPVSSTVTQQGLTITLVAQPGATTVDWGDGTVITCQSMTVRRQGLDPYAESPDCGHVYELPDDYTVTATRQWLVSWSAGGQSGVVELTSSDELVMPIGEIVTVLVPER